jgi:hypothetical protein
MPAYLTFNDLSTLIRKDFDVIGHGPYPINISTPDAFNFYDFEQVEPRIPGRDRIVRMSFYSSGSDGLPWGWSVRDRDDHGDAYAEIEGLAATLDEALAAVRAVPWTPPVARLLHLLCIAPSPVTCSGGVFTFPNDIRVPVPTTLHA